VTEQHPAVRHLIAAHAKAEEVARLAADDDGPEWEDEGSAVYQKGTNNPIVVGPWTGYLPDGERQHIALHDPASVLRRVAAERRILAEHADDGTGDCTRCARESEERAGLGYFHEPLPWPCPTVLGLAAAWGWEADHA
jgi:hypothetical protein